MFIGHVFNMQAAHVMNAVYIICGGKCFNDQLIKAFGFTWKLHAVLEKGWN